MTLEQCSKASIFCYPISYEVLGILTWVAFILTVVGFIIAIHQVRQAIRSAESAKDAASGAQTAVRVLAYHVNGVNLAYLSAQMNTIMHLVRSEEFALAHTFFAPIKRSIRLYAREKNLSINATDAINRTLGKLDAQLELGRSQDPKYKIASANKHIDDILSQLTLWEGETSESSRKEITNEITRDVNT